MIKTDFLFKNNNLIPYLSEDYYHKKIALSFSSYKNALIQPECISIEKEQYALGLYCNGKYINFCPSFEYTVRGKIKAPFCCEDKSDKKVIYIGPLVRCWGHFVTDCISTMWFFINDVLKEQYKDYYVAYIPIEGFEMKGNYQRMFDLFGIDRSRFLLINKPTIFKEVIVPDCSYFAQESNDIRMFTDEYIKTIDFLKANISRDYPKHKDKIYFTNRSYTKVKKSFGLNKLDSFFEKHGFEVIHPEQYSLDEQIKMIDECNFFASTDGSCGHNSVFLNSRTKAIIFPRGPDLTGYQECLCFVHDVEVYFIDSTLSIFTPYKKTHVGPMYYYVSEELLSFFGEHVTNYKKYCKENFYDLKKYISYGTSLNRITNSCTVHAQKLFYYYSMMKRMSFRYRLKNCLKFKLRLKNKN